MPSFMLTAAFEPWIHARVAEALWTVARRTPGARIGAYAGAAFAQVVTEALAHADRIGSRLGGDDESPRTPPLHRHPRYGWMVWDAVWD